MSTDKKQENKNTVPSLLNLSDELLLSVLMKLDPSTIFPQIPLICKEFNRIALSHPANINKQINETPLRVSLTEDQKAILDNVRTKRAIYRGLTTIVAEVLRIKNPALNYYQKAGIEGGLTLAQVVNPEGFSIGHMRAHEAGRSYEDYVGLSSDQARALSINPHLTRADLDVSPSNVALVAPSNASLFHLTQSASTGTTPTEAKNAAAINPRETRQSCCILS